MSDFHDKQQKYLTDVELLIQPFTNILMPNTVYNIRSLVEHGEAAEGVNYLAWAIVNEKIQITQETADKIYKFTAGLVDPEHMPADLDKFITA